MLTDVLILGLLGMIVIYLIKRIRIRDLKTYIFLSVVIGIYIYGIIHIKYPEEKIGHAGTIRLIPQLKEDLPLEIREKVEIEAVRPTHVQLEYVAAGAPS